MDVYAKWALPPVLAAFAVAASLIALLAGIVLGFVRARRRDAVAATAESAVSERPPSLIEGSEVVLSGIVRHFEDHQVAVKVSVSQTGTEAEMSGSWSHSWIEIDREITLAPFLLELSNGQKVLVDPPNNVDVADALDQKVWIDRNHRVLSAELVPGEQIYARGRLERSDQATASGAYRDVTWGWTLRASAGQMLLSSEPLGRGLRERARFHRGAAVLGITLLLASQLTLVWFYSRLAGTTETATVTDESWYQTTDTDGDRTNHYAVHVRRESVEVSGSDYGGFHTGQSVAIRYASEDNWELGASPTITWWHGLIIAGAAIVFWIYYWLRRASSRPWFRRRVKESGSGRLPDRA